MGNSFYKIKIGLYIFVIVLVGALFIVRVHNALQKTDYLTKSIFENGDVTISISYPEAILSPKNDVSYPLTISFNHYGNLTQSHTYEVFLEAPSLLFVDAKGADVAPHFQFTDEHAFIEQNIYIRPFLAETYPMEHGLNAQVLIDGQKTQIQSVPIEIQTEPWWFSFLSLAAAAFLEVSIFGALVTWVIGALDSASNTRKERISQIRKDFGELSSLGYLEQMSKFIYLEKQVKEEHLDELGGEIKSISTSFSGREWKFVAEVGRQLRAESETIRFEKIQEDYDRFFSEHKESIDALIKIIKLSGQKEIPIPLISALMKLWDKFDADAKDLIIGALKQLPPATLSTLPAAELSEKVFATTNYRRLLRDVEIQRIFPQLVDPTNGEPLLVGYDAAWLHLPEHADDPKIIDWLKQYTLVANPFGPVDKKNFPFYPEGFARPNKWGDLWDFNPQYAQCPTPEDSRALSFLLRSECLPTQKKDSHGNETANSGKQIFPIWVSLNQTAPLETPLLTLARSAAQAWMDILPLSPDAMLDLLPAEQVALLELLCWAFGSNVTVINLLKRAGLKDNETGRLLIRRISEFKAEFSSSYITLDSVLISWLKVRPPDLNCTYLIIQLDELPVSARPWWLEQFSPLISALFLNGIITKAFSSPYVSNPLPLSVIRLNWSDSQLKISLDSQFDRAVQSAIDLGMPKERKIQFIELFGSGSFGYNETEERTTNRLVSASRNSLARMSTLGNCLLQRHCEQEVPEKYLSVEELETILKEA